MAQITGRVHIFRPRIKALALLQCWRKFHSAGDNYFKEARSQMLYKTKLNIINFVVASFTSGAKCQRVKNIDTFLVFQRVKKWTYEEGG